ncbi:lipid binding protein [Trifolium pratense]|uniref:Lipid binding protein n=1 Tax=Trifolium pratense TaxID=57577 RepID=A0A2K3NNK4_TRIPR|nr:lipid binding protein [Trifolium pratense]
MRISSTYKLMFRLSHIRCETLNMWQGHVNACMRVSCLMIACATAGEAREWIEAFDHAKQQAEYELLKGGSARDKLNMEAEINLEGHRPRVRRYAHGLKKLIRIGQGPETLLRQSSKLAGRRDGFEGDSGDTVEAHQWKCVLTVAGIRIFEDVSDHKNGKGVLAKSVGVIDATADTVFEVLFNTERQKRYEWDMLVCDLELVESYDGHYDVVYGTYDPKYLSRWHPKQDFVLSRQWFRGQDGAYTSSWEIRNLNSPMVSNSPRCLVTHTLEIHSTSWNQWKNKRCSKFERSIPYALLCQVAMAEAITGYYTSAPDLVTTFCFLLFQEIKPSSNMDIPRAPIIASISFASYSGGHGQSCKQGKSRQYAMFGSSLAMLTDFLKWYKEHQASSSSTSVADTSLKEYIAANPALHQENATTIVHSKIPDTSISSSEYEDEVQDEFYDAIAAESSSSDEESDDDEKHDLKESRVKLKNVSWAITALALKRSAAPDLSGELDPRVTPITIHPSDIHGSLRKGVDDNDTNCWSSPSGKGFMIRGKNYLKDNSKVVGGDPLLKLIAVDWFTVNKSVDRIALHPKCLVQSEVGKKLPFILVINLQVPAKPNYSLVLYYAADRPINKNSLLAKFVDGSDVFRDSTFKLIPSIVEGYWMVKRAVGTKACLLGKAVTCKYFRQDNFLEIDVDIGSSSVARGVIGLVLGYVTSLVVDLAILIEAKEEAELPEYILGTVRLNRLKLESAIPLEA